MFGGGGMGGMLGMGGGLGGQGGGEGGEEGSGLQGITGGNDEEPTSTLTEPTITLQEPTLTLESPTTGLALVSQTLQTPTLTTPVFIQSSNLMVPTRPTRLSSTPPQNSSVRLSASGSNVSSFSATSTASSRPLSLLTSSHSSTASTQIPSGRGLSPVESNSSSPPASSTSTSVDGGVSSGVVALPIIGSVLVVCLLAGYFWRRRARRQSQAWTEIEDEESAVDPELVEKEWLRESYRVADTTACPSTLSVIPERPPRPPSKAFSPREERHLAMGRRPALSQARATQGFSSTDPSSPSSENRGHRRSELPYAPGRPVTPELDTAEESSNPVPIRIPRISLSGLSTSHDGQSMCSSSLAGDDDGDEKLLQPRSRSRAHSMASRPSSLTGAVLNGDR